MAAAVVDWIAIRLEYETSGLSYRKLAEKHNVKFPTLRDRAKRESWVKGKEKTRNKILTKTLQKSVTSIAKRNARILAISDMATEAIEEYFKEHHYKKHVVKIKEYFDGKADSEHLESPVLDVADTKALANMVASFEKLQKIQRLGEGVLDEADRQHLELAKQKLKSDTSLAEVIALSNERVLRLADLINNPVPDRHVEDFEDD